MNVETLDGFDGFGASEYSQAVVQDVKAQDTCSDRVLQIWTSLADLERGIWDLELDRENNRPWSHINFSPDYVEKLRAELLGMADRLQKLSS